MWRLEFWNFKYIKNDPNIVDNLWVLYHKNNTFNEIMNNEYVNKRNSIGLWF